jgi:peptide/nickel transport system permease protein
MLKIKKVSFSLAVFFSIILVSIVGPIIYKTDPFEKVGPREQGPSQLFPLGTDTYGRDLLAQMLQGIRNSMYVGVISAAIATSVGVLIGVIAGFKGGTGDSLLMLVTDVVFLLPSILIMMLIAAYVQDRSFYLIAAIIGATSWPWIARSVRAQILTLKARDFVNMSKMSGLSDAKIIFFDLIPNMFSMVFLSFVSLVSRGMIAEAGLSMIGLGMTKNTSLGIILYFATQGQAVRRNMWWWFIPPGLLLVVLTTSLLLLSISLDEYFSPRLRGD